MSRPPPGLKLESPAAFIGKQGGDVISFGSGPRFGYALSADLIEQGLEPLRRCLEEVAALAA